MSKVLILGATGKLGAALRRYWAECPPAGLELVWLSRADLEAPVPEAAAVVALWGVTQCGKRPGITHWTCCAARWISP